MKYKHMSSSDRLEIEKDCTTIAKEVKNHIIYKNIGESGCPFFDCVNHKNCCFKVRSEKCNPKTCEHYQKEIYKKLEKHPYVCNGCHNRSGYTLSKQFYEGIYAFNEYKDTLVEAKSGKTYSEKKIENLNKILVPLVKEQKQSIHHAYINNKNSIMCSEKEIYN